MSKTTINDTTSFTIVASPIGRLTLVAAGDALTGLYFEDDPQGAAATRGAVRDERPLRRAAEQLEAYFAGRRDRFELALAPRGTAFQQAVWRALQKIPFGETATYGDIARAIGKPAAVRAIGGANHRNPIAIVIPCHRVIGADGTMTGYGGGLDRKRTLLALEAGAAVAAEWRTPRAGAAKSALG
ncbi:MAG TPA: methylated-DNA--[protein]-cysteine S-methyltransferase [Polyangia bacterium]|nr:methylated-DNA--[protein]-cysteine S-methyltransferase [Polyangia bacterium]